MMWVRVYCMPSSILIREKRCALSTRCSRREVRAKAAMNMTNMKIDEGVTAVLLISKSLKFKKYSTNSITSDNFIGSSPFPCFHKPAGLYSLRQIFSCRRYTYGKEKVIRGVTCSSYVAPKQMDLKKLVEMPRPICYRAASVICGSTSMRR